MNDGGSAITSYKVEWKINVDSVERANPELKPWDIVFRSVIITSQPEIQIITTTSSAGDVSGYFVVHFMGQISNSIHYNSDEHEVKNALEAMSTVITVHVTLKVIAQSAAPPLVSPGRQWYITFISQPGDIPSLLVDMGFSQPSNIATGGTLSGSSPIVAVVTAVNCC